MWNATPGVGDWLPVTRRIAGELYPRSGLMAINRLRSSSEGDRQEPGLIRCAFFRVVLFHAVIGHAVITILRRVGLT